MVYKGSRELQKWPTTLASTSPH